MFKEHSACRVCGNTALVPVLDLGEQPFANNLRAPTDRRPEPTAPLSLLWCSDCGLSQLSVVVDPDVLYSGYRFRSGVSRAWHVHCEEFAKEVYAQGNPRFVIDIAANDGCQLAYIRKHSYSGGEAARVLGVDPSGLVPMLVGTAQHEVPADLPIVQGFWDASIATKIVEQHGTADLIVAQNVVGHVDDVRLFFYLCGYALAEHGRLAVEVPHVADMMRGVAFDTIYHEHVSYWSTKPIQRAAASAGLKLVRVQWLNVHGGSRRFWFAPKNSDTQPDDTVQHSLDLDEKDGLSDPRTYEDFAGRVRSNLCLTQKGLRALEGQGKRVWAYGASAKGTVYLNALKARGNTVWPEVIIDETPDKQGFLSPGVNIPIRPFPESFVGCDVLWLLSWNWATELKARARARGFQGQFLVALPSPTLSDA